jgi:hypothetical protein
LQERWAPIGKLPTSHRNIASAKARALAANLKNEGKSNDNNSATVEAMDSLDESNFTTVVNKKKKQNNNSDESDLSSPVNDSKRNKIEQTTAESTLPDLSLFIKARLDSVSRILSKNNHSNSKKTYYN